MGQAEAGDTVEVSLGYAANVRVLTDKNYALYRDNRPHQFTGGYIERSPYRVTLAENASWFVVIDAGSYFGKIKSLVKLKPSEAAAQTGRSPYAPEPTICESILGQGLAVSKNKSRLFILHLYKDTNGIVSPLADALAAENLTAYYEDFALEPGDSLMDALKTGLTKYKFGVVVLSRAFLRTGWRAADVEYLRGLLMSEYRDLYPVWYNVSRQDVIHHFPAIAALMPNKPGEKDIATIVEEISETLWL
jgi:hypothetical protein